MKSLNCLLLLVALSLLTLTVGAQPTQVLLVRHAERADQPERDPVLSALGQARAALLAERLGDAGIGTIVVTQFARTQLTAAPLAARIGVEPMIVDAASGQLDAHVAAVVSAVRAQPGVVLVVGHSNTLSPIVAALGGPSLPDLEAWEYSHLLVLHAESDGMRLERMRYGASDAPPPAAGGD